MSVSARCSGRPRRPTRNRNWGCSPAAAGLPSVGIGGIDVTNAGAVIRAGVDGVAVISAIQSAPNVQQAAESLALAVNLAKIER
jgi:thiamine monophosphate synthase